VRLRASREFRLAIFVASASFDLAQEFKMSNASLANSRSSVHPGSHRRVARRFHSPTVAIELLESRRLLTNFNIQGQVLWTDTAGNTHPVPQADIEFYEIDGNLGSGFISAAIGGTFQTDQNGNYSINFTNVEDGPGEGLPDIVARVFTRSAAADIKSSVAGSSTYFINSAIAGEISEGSSRVVNITAGNTGDANRAFSVHNSVLMISQYLGNLTGASPSQLDVRYDSSITGSFFRASPRQLYIRGTAAYQWDVIQHEFGHYVQNLYGFQNNPGGAHSATQNLSQTRGSKDIGTRLAWGEGWSTFFSISAQQAMGAAALGIPQVGDSVYQSTNGGVISYSTEVTGGVGEDNELTVINTLWDLFDSTADGIDDVSLTDKFLFDTFNNANPFTLAAAWESLAATRDNAGKVELGAIFGQNNVAPVLTGPANDAPMTGSVPPTFTWIANGGGVPNPNNDFKIKFYNSDFTKVVFEKTLGNVLTYTPTVGEWGTIRSGDGVVKWVVEGRNTSNPVTPSGPLGYYWSGARTLGSAGIVFVIDDTGSFSEEIAGVQAAFSKYLDEFSKRGVSPPMMQVISFKDDVTVHITSRDLAAVKNVVNALVASGGGDCPEASAAALVKASESVAIGGTIMLATDASTHRGTNITALIEKLRAKGVKVDVVLSGDCGTIGSASTSVGSLSSAGPIATVEEDECNGEECGCGDDDDPGVEHAIVPRGAFPLMSAGIVHEPGGDGSDDDDPQPPVVDPGQPPIDEYGNTHQTAQKLMMNGRPILGGVGSTGDQDDYFSIDLEAGKVYTALIESDDFNAFFGTLSLFDRDGVTQLDSTSTPGILKIKPTVSGKYYLDVKSFSRFVYTLEVTDDPLAGVTSAVELFSAVSAATGGVFLVHDEVNTGSPEAFTAAMFNVLATTLGPAIISANPGAAPQGQTVSVTLTGSGTNWRSGVTTLSFSDPGIVVKSLAVLNANTLTAELQINASVAQDFYDATVVSNLGGGKTETSVGVDVLQITAAVTAPTLLGVDPANLSKGTGGSVVIRGANVHWTASSIVDLGPGVLVKAVHFVNATQLKVDYEVNASADTGFRTAIVTQGAEVVQRERAFFVGVKNLAIASLTGIDTPNGKTGATLAVKITGENTHFEAGKTTASFGDGIDIVSVVVNSATEIVVTLKIRNDAALGFRNVTVTTDGETAALLSGFFVEAGVPGGNHAPVLNPNGNPNQSNIHEDIPLASNLGNHIATLISRMTPGGGITDPDAGALKGVAVIGANQMYGTWQFTTDNGTTWKEFGNTSSANALFLASNNATRVRFVPKTNYAGTVGFTFVAWDQTSGENGKTGSALVRGGASSLSVDKDHSFITVNPINDAPVLNPKGEPTITRKTGDSPSVSQNGTPVAQIIQRMGPSGNITDVDPNALPGIAVIGANQMGGTWEYTKNGGGTWVPFGETSNAAALLLAADAQTRVRFLPGPNFSGQTGFTFLGWDRTTGVNGTKVNAQTRGGTTAFSIDKENCLLTDGGNVQAITAGGILALRGDGFANDVTIVVNDNGTMTLTPNRGTQINGQDGPLTVIASLLGSALMGDGADKLRVLSERAVELAKDSVVDMGSGDDLLHVQRVIANKRAQVRLGAGRDRLELLDTVFSSLVSTDFSAEDTIVTL
jgi:hypothetical protein